MSQLSSSGMRSGSDELRFNPTGLGSASVPRPGNGACPGRLIKTGDAVDDPIQLPFKRSHLLEPPPLLRCLQAQASVHKVRTRVGDEAWLVTGYEQVKRLLSDDERLGRSHPDPDNAPRATDTALFGKPRGNYDTERSDHARMRTLL